MSENSNNIIEEQFELLEKETPVKRWNNPNFLLKLAAEHESSNLPLAYRLLQRAHNLNPKNGKVKSEMRRYAASLKKSHPDFMDSTGQSQGGEFTAKIKERVQESSLVKKVYSLKPFTLFVLIPTLMFLFYQSIWASERYESTAQLIVKQPDSAMSVSPELALLGGLGGSTVNNDAKIVQAYILSNDMLSYLEETLSIKSHFSSSSVDFFSRLHSWDSHEDFLALYKKYVEIIIDQDSGIIELKVQAFNDDFSLLLSQTIIARAEWFINEIGHKLANEQLSFIKKEHQNWVDNLEKAQKKLLTYQQSHRLLDPTAEGAALQSIAYNIESQITARKTELLAAEGIMSENAPPVIKLKNEILALQEQLKSERERLTYEGSEQLSVSEVIAKFSDLKVDYELALQAYTASLASLEKVRVEAYRQIKFLMTVEQPNLPDASSYPKVFYNVFLFFVITGLFFGIVRIIIATIKELS